MTWGRQMGEFYAHSTERRPPSDWETMAEHEARTAHLCRQFLRRSDLSPTFSGNLLGHCHDLRKYDERFRRWAEGPLTAHPAGAAKRGRAT